MLSRYRSFPYLVFREVVLPSVLPHTYKNLSFWLWGVEMVDIIDNDIPEYYWKKNLNSLPVLYYIVWFITSLRICIDSGFEQQK